MKKYISIVTPTYNEVENIKELYKRVCRVMSKMEGYRYEIIVIDNASTDGTVEVLKELANQDPSFKVILNTRNFGHLRSPYWGVLQSFGDATVYLASDLQDPPELIPDLISEWEKGSKVVLGVKPTSSTSFAFHYLRKLYYRLLDGVSDVKIVKDATGFGLYDRDVIDAIRNINDPCPFFRGLVCELGFDIATLDFKQPARVRGISKNNFYTLYDTAWLGLVSHSLVPIRMASFLGIAIGLISILLAFVAFILKLIWWSQIPAGIAPIEIALFFMFGVVLIFIGVLGEYIGTMLTYLQNRPVVVERDRINFRTNEHD